MSAAYTPGPWGIIRAGTQIGIAPFDKRGKPRGGRGEEDIAGMSKWRGESEEEATANAMLIRAAPDLLEALIGVVAVADRSTVEFDAARAAIARATGK